jgi:hypothetical protein
MTARENTHSHRQLLNGFFDCPRCKRTFNRNRELSFKVSFRHIILAQMLRAPQNKPATSRAGSPVQKWGRSTSPATRNQQQLQQNLDDFEDHENEYVVSAPSAKQIGGRVRPSSASRGAGGKGNRPDSAILQLRQMGVAWEKEDLLTMQSWALDDSVKDLQRRLKLKSLEQITSSLSANSSFASSAVATAASNPSGSDPKRTAPALFLPTWELQQLPQERLTAFQREVRQNHHQRTL